MSKRILDGRMTFPTVYRNRLKVEIGCGFFLGVASVQLVRENQDQKENKHWQIASPEEKYSQSLPSSDSDTGYLVAPSALWALWPV